MAIYLLDDMIDMGFPHAQKPKWKSKKHRQAAINVCIGNPLIGTRDDLIATVQAINAISKKDLETCTIADLAFKFSVPNIVLS